MRITKWFSRQKLNMKFTLVIGIMVFIPIAIFMIFSYKSLRDTAYEQAITTLQWSMTQSYNQVQKTIDSCNTTTQVFLNNGDFINYLSRLKEDDEISTAEVFNFYQNRIRMLEKMLNSNPYIYQIRVYAESNNFSEMMPILYKKERMESLEWADSYRSGEWALDYEDTLFSKTMNAPDHMMGLITEITDYEDGRIGVVEVAIEMEEVFGDIFHNTNEDWRCFVDSEGKFHYGSKGGGSVFDIYVPEIMERYGHRFNQQGYFATSMAGKEIVIGIQPMKELSGTYINIVNMDRYIRDFKVRQFQYITLLMLVFVIFIYLINVVVRVLLRKFDMISDVVTQVKDGNLATRVRINGQDEMALLGKQIDNMLDTIEILHKENIDRELLMRNTEIKALQNQINAHFIYNVLESIKMMAEIDERYEISDAITSLGKLLRYGMKWSQKNVTVGQELEYVRNYLDLINLRFEFEINLSITVPENILIQEIPKISLQPIVENAIYHGIEEVAEDASIYIKAIVREEDFDIEITDSGKGMTPEEVHKLRQKIYGHIETAGGSGNGIGLKNVQDRIRMSFGEDYGLSVASKEKCYTKVIVTLPITVRR